MRIGVVTFWWGQDNYGQIAQCYALQSVLRRMGHEPFIVRCRPQSTLKSRLAQFFRMLQSPHARERRKSWNAVVRPGTRRFREFLEERCVFSAEAFDSFAALKENCPEADAFIVGSDQVWNCNADANGRIWFLDFVPAGSKKIAYAASFGKIRAYAAFKAFCREKLESFDAVGVREQEGADFLKSLGVEATLVADPTLLLSRGAYDALAGTPSSENESFAFCYWLGRHDPEDVLPVAEVAEFLSGRGLPLKSVVGGVPFPTEGLGEIGSPTFPQWLASIRDAEVVFTNSFHGTVFCLIFRKPMVVFPSRSGIGNGRLRSLLSLCGLESRIYARGENPVERILSQKINWENVGERLREHVRLSEEFLNRSLGKCSCSCKK